MPTIDFHPFVLHKAIKTAGSPVHHAELTPHGQLLLVQGSHLHVFEAKTGKLQHSITSKTGFIEGFAASWDRVALITTSQTVDVWDLQTGQHLQTLATQASAVACRPQGDLLFLKTAPATLAIWDFQTLTFLREFETSRKNFHVLQVRSDGRQLALGGACIEVLDLPECISRFTLNLEFGASQMHFHPEGLGIVDAAPDVQEEHVQWVSVLDGATLYTVGQERDHFSDTSPHAFVGEDLLISCGASGGLLLHHSHLQTTEAWETGSPKVTLLRFQQGLLVVGDVTGQVQLFDVHQKKLVQSFQAFDSIVHQVDCAAEAPHFLTLGNNNQVQVWELPNCTLRFDHSFQHPTRLARLGADGNLLAALWVNEDEQFLEVLNTTTGEVVYDNEERITALAFSVSPPALFGFGKRITRWLQSDFSGMDVLEPARVRRGQVVPQENTFHVEGDLGPSRGDTSPDGRLLVLSRSTRSGRGVVILWDLQEQSEITRIDFEVAVKKLRWIPRTEQVLVHLRNDRALLWRPKSQEQQVLPFRAQAITVDRLGKLLAVSTEGCEVHLLDASTFKVLQTLQGFATPVDSLAFDASGTHLVTSSGDVDQQSTFNVYGQACPCGGLYPAGATGPSERGR